MVNVPLASVMALVVVPLFVMFTPGNGSPNSSTTFPLKVNVLDSCAIRLTVSILSRGINMASSSNSSTVISAIYVCSNVTSAALLLSILFSARLMASCCSTNDWGFCVVCEGVDGAALWDSVWGVMALAAGDDACWLVTAGADFANAARLAFSDSVSFSIVCASDSDSFASSDGNNPGVISISSSFV